MDKRISGLRNNLERLLQIRNVMLKYWNVTVTH